MKQYLVLVLSFSVLVSISQASVYFATLKGFGEGNDDVTGRVRVFVADTSRHATRVAYAGVANNVPASRTAADCTETNACGAHIHTGTSCESVEAQMGHYYNGTEIDPWLTEIYESDADGIGRFQGVVETGTNDVAGRAFVVHDDTGARISCGILELENEEYTSYMCPPFSTIRLGTRQLRSMRACACLEGFQRQGRTCASIECGQYECPKNSSAKKGRDCIYSIRDCACDEGYRKKGGYCVPVPISTST